MRKTRTDGDEIRTCVSCGMKVMARGDEQSWKGLQMDPDVPELDWYCTKDICKAALKKGIEQARAIWAEKRG